MAEKEVQLPKKVSRFTYNKVKRLEGYMGFELMQAQQRPELRLVALDDIDDGAGEVDNRTLPFPVEGSIFSDDNSA